MTSGGWGTPYEDYKDEKLEEIIKIIRPHLKNKGAKSEKAVLVEVAKITGKLKKNRRRKGQATFGVSELRSLTKNYGKYAQSLEKIDDRTIEFLENILLISPYAMKHIEFQAENLGFKQIFSVERYISHVLKSNDLLLKILDILRDPRRKSGKKDTEMRRAVLHLYLLYKRVTGRSFGGGTRLRHFIEAALEPVVNLGNNGVKGYLAEIKKDASIGK